LDDAAEVKAIINSNHMDMCRFSSKEDDGYCKIRQTLSGHVREIKQGIEVQRHSKWINLRLYQVYVLMTLVSGKLKLREGGKRGLDKEETGRLFSSTAVPH
jgi:hypothetical protein